MTIDIMARKEVKEIIALISSAYLGSVFSKNLVPFKSIPISSIKVASTTLLQVTPASIPCRQKAVIHGMTSKGVMFELTGPSVRQIAITIKRYSAKKVSRHIWLKFPNHFNVKSSATKTDGTNRDTHALKLTIDMFVEIPKSVMILSCSGKNKNRFIETRVGRVA